MDHLCYSPAGKELTFRFLFVMFHYDFATFPCGIPGQVWYLIYRFLNFATFLTRIRLDQQVINLVRLLYESVNQNVFLISQPPRVLWVFKRTFSMGHFF